MEGDLIMRGFYLYYLISMITGNPFIAIAAVIFIYVIIDRYYLGFLSGITGFFKKNNQIRINLKELELNPQNARAAFSLGVLYFERRKFHNALKYLDHPKLKEDSTASYYNYLGMTLMELDRVDEGKKYIEKALESDPRSGYGLPYIYLIKDEMKRGETEGEKIAELQVKMERFANTENLYKMGLIVKKSGDKNRAREFFSKALIEYSYCPKGIRRLHRKWAILSRIQKSVLL